MGSLVTVPMPSLAPSLPIVSPAHPPPPCLEKCYTVPLRVSKEVFKVLSTSGIPFSAVKSPPGVAAMFPVLYLFALYFFVIKRGWVGR